MPGTLVLCTHRDAVYGASAHTYHRRPASFPGTNIYVALASDIIDQPKEWI